MQLSVSRTMRVARNIPVLTWAIKPRFMSDSKYGEYPRYKGIDLDAIFQMNAGSDAIKYRILSEVRLAEIDISRLSSQVKSLKNELVMTNTKFYYINQTLSLRCMIEKAEADRVGIEGWEELSRAQKWIKIFKSEEAAFECFKQAGLDNSKAVGSAAVNVYRKLSKGIHEYPYDDKLVVYLDYKVWSRKRDLPFIMALADFLNVKMTLKDGYSENVQLFKDS